jgi:hydroxymethylglutaryl-CoA lyase
MDRELPKQVTICESVAREGLQAELKFVPTDKKIEIINAAVGLGFKKIEVGSFSSPKVLPQLADVIEVTQRIIRKPGVAYITIVPNEKGLDRAIDAMAKGCVMNTIDVMVACTDAHELAATKRTVAESLAILARMTKRARDAGLKVISVLLDSFGSMHESVPLDRVVELTRELREQGAHAIKLADVGLANPATSYRLFSRLRERFPDTELIAHFHDSRGMGLANCLAALQAGITFFDTSIGRTGGPLPTMYASPGARGNVCTEDLVCMFNEMGIDTGIDTQKLIEYARFVEGVFGRELAGNVTRAGWTVKS